VDPIEDVDDADDAVLEAPNPASDVPLDSK